MRVRDTLAQTLILGVICAAVTMAAAPPAGACSIGVPAASVTFVGTASAVDQSSAKATFLVETVESTDTARSFPGHPQPPVLFPHSGDTIVVGYATDIDALEIGGRYRVSAYTPSASEVTWESTTLAFFLRMMGDCGQSESPARTTHADGSRIESTLRYDVRRFAAADVRWQLGVAVGVVVVAAGAFVLVRRRRRGSERSNLESNPALAASEGSQLSGRPPPKTGGN